MSRKLPQEIKSKHYIIERELDLLGLFPILTGILQILAGSYIIDKYYDVGYIVGFLLVLAGIAIFLGGLIILIGHKVMREVHLK